nr:hypothetical protein Iba_chr10aCG12120 [Ipomoea batatas]
MSNGLFDVRSLSSGPAHNSGIHGSKENRHRDEETSFATSDGHEAEVTILSDGEEWVIIPHEPKQETMLVVFNFLMDVNSFVDESSDDESSPYDGEYDSFYDDDEDDTSSPSKNVAPTPNDRDPPSPDLTTRPKRKRHKAL